MKARDLSKTFLIYLSQIDFKIIMSYGKFHENSFILLLCNFGKEKIKSLLASTRAGTGADRRSHESNAFIRTRQKSNR